MDAGRCLVVIPARGGSVGIARKNVARLGGRVLLSYALEAAVESGMVVVVSTDDDEIAFLAGSLGAEVVRRGADLSGDGVTLDPVVFDALVQMEGRMGGAFDVVCTLQPTSPLIGSGDILEMVQMLRGEGLDTVVGAVEDTALRWELVGGKWGPCFSQRINRQWLPRQVREMGVMVSRRDIVTKDSRIGPLVGIFEIERQKAVDLDGPLDWLMAESLLARRRVAFVVIGDSVTGTGHGHRAMTLAQGMVGQDVYILCWPGSDVAKRLLESNHYPVIETQDVAQTLMDLHVDLVINDVLDTTEDYMKALGRTGAVLVNLEDEGQGAPLADLVINALYGSGQQGNVVGGETYFCLRNEFFASAKHHVQPQVTKILLSFGGTDPSDLTRRSLEAIDSFCARRHIRIDIVCGVGYLHREALQGQIEQSQGQVQIHHNVRVMSKYMQQADVCLTSYGRTLYELASLGTPTIALAQNDRELRHSFVHSDNGIVALGMGRTVHPTTLVTALKELCDDETLRQAISQKMRRVDLSQGANRVIARIWEVADSLQGQKTREESP